MQKIVWITGASSGIGKAIAQEFAINNINIAISSRREKELESLAVLLKQNDNDVISCPLNLQKPEEISKSAKLVANNFDIDCLINNAGITSFKSGIDTSFEEMKEIIETNLLGAMYATKSVLPYMIEIKKGTIINIISVAAEKVFVNSSAYAASKAGLRAYAKALREEVRDHNIRVINILPGATKTPIWDNMVLEKYGERMMNPQNLAKLIYDVYTYQTNFVTEEIIVRPLKGDI